MILQVFHLTEAGIGCAFLSGGMEWQEQTAVYDRLRCSSPDNAVILFITPEKVRLGRCDFQAALHHSLECSLHLCNLPSATHSCSQEDRCPSRCAFDHRTMANHANRALSELLEDKHQ